VVSLWAWLGEGSCDRYGGGVPPPAERPPQRRPSSTREDRHTPWSDIVIWMVTLAVGLALSYLLRRWQAPRFSALSPFVRAWHLRLNVADAVAAVIAVLVVLGGLRRWLDRVAWPFVLLGAFLVSAAWTVSLALAGTGGLAGRTVPGGITDAARAIGDSPGAYLRSATQPGAEGLPRGATLVVWGLQHLGLHTAAGVGLALTLAGCLSVPLVLIAVRSLCHEPAARRLAPVLAVAPYAIWMAGSIDGLVLTLTAGAIACGTVGSEPDRTPAWAAAAGFLLGIASLISYVAWLLAAAVVITYFVRRRPLPNLITGVAFLVPLFGAQLAGFVWSSGFTAARAQVSGTSPRQSLPAWLLVDVLAVLAVSGPTLVASARKIRRTPGWPFLLGAGIGLGFAVATGLSRGDAERVLLPFLPWLLVAAVAPERRPTSGDALERTAAVFPALLTAVGCVLALAWRIAIESPW
jgi:hypothetical protein